MTKQTTTRHRYTRLVHLMYAAAVLAALVWAGLLLLDGPARLVGLALALANALPLAAYVLDVWHTNEEESA